MASRMTAWCKADLYQSHAFLLSSLSDTRKSAFSVASSRSQWGQEGQAQHVTFDHTLANKGGDYLMANDSFLCRLPGFYFFTFT